MPEAKLSTSFDHDLQIALQLQWNNMSAGFDEDVKELLRNQKEDLSIAFGTNLDRAL